MKKESYAEGKRKFFKSITTGTFAWKKIKGMKKIITKTSELIPMDLVLSFRNNYKMILRPIIKNADVSFPKTQKYRIMRNDFEKGRSKLTGALRKPL